MLSEEGPVFRNRPLSRYLVDFWISTDPLRFLTVEGLGDVSQLPKPGRVRRPPDPHDILRSDVRARIATPLLSPRLSLWGILRAGTTSILTTGDASVPIT